MEPSMSLFNVGFVIFPELTQLDFTGPQQVLARLPHSAMHIIAKSAAPVSSDSGLSLLPTHTFENCPRLDLICIPGGSTGVVRAMGDRDTIEFVRRQSVMAKYVTSVCTGAFILGAAGLLQGRRATTHWAFTELLPLVGATHEKGRVVKDGNVLSAGSSGVIAACWQDPVSLRGQPPPPDGVMPFISTRGTVKPCRGARHCSADTPAFLRIGVHLSISDLRWSRNASGWGLAEATV